MLNFQPLLIFGKKIVHGLTILSSILYIVFFLYNLKRLKPFSSITYITVNDSSVTLLIDG